MKYNYKKGVLVVFVFLVVIALIITISSFVKALLGLSDDTVISMAISIVEVVGVLISLIVAVRQLSDSKEISRASFVTELNRTFTENKDNMELYTALQDCLDSKCAKENNCTEETECNLKFPKVVVSNYLTFFETIYLLEKNGAIDFEMLDDLFAYRFFLAVHSKFVQQVKLKPQPENFKNIFCLEYEWMMYRKNKAGKNDAENSVYKKNKLENLLVTEEQKEMYSKWIKECRNF
ncbi:MAG: hypothetical protein E7480_06895 [Ruminococcaceae bacterium]|nr:hypothetical protein [Oscillospiraceae bacterium]